VAGRVDQIQKCTIAVLRFVVESHGVGFDRDPTLALGDPYRRAPAPTLSRPVTAPVSSSRRSANVDLP